MFVVTLRHDPVATARGSDTKADLYLCGPFHGLRLFLMDAYPAMKSLGYFGRLLEARQNPERVATGSINQVQS